MWKAVVLVDLDTGWTFLDTGWTRRHELIGDGLGISKWIAQLHSLIRTQIPVLGWIIDTLRQTLELPAHSDSAVAGYVNMELRGFH